MPYASKAQQRFFHAAQSRGDIPSATVKEYDKATDFSKLPERKSRRQKMKGKKSSLRNKLEESLGE